MSAAVRVPSPEVTLVDDQLTIEHLPQEQAKPKPEERRKFGTLNFLIATVLLALLGVGAYYLYSINQPKEVVSAINETKNNIISHSDSSSGSGSSKAPAKQSSNKPLPRSHRPTKSFIGNPNIRSGAGGDDPNEEDNQDEDKRRKEKMQGRLHISSTTAEEEEEDESEVSSQDSEEVGESAWTNPRESTGELVPGNVGSARP